MLIRSACKFLGVCIVLCLLSPLAVSVATSGDFYFTGTSPSSPLPDGRNVTFSAHAEWYQGIDQIQFFDNADPSGSYLGAWWNFANVPCYNSTNCNVSATLNYASAIFSLHGRHLVVINAMLSTAATGGDTFYNGRWYMTWWPSQSQRSQVFWWASTPQANNSGPGVVVHGDVTLYNVTATDADSNLSGLQLYYSNIAAPNSWVQSGSSQACSGGSCSITAYFNTAQVFEPSGYFVYTVNVWNTNGLWCSGNITASDTDLWGNPLNIPQAGPCGIYATTTVTILQPTINGSITEVEYPGCRWPHTSGQYFGINYRWGDYIASGTAWRTAFEGGLTDWNFSDTKPYFQYTPTGSVLIDTIYERNGSDGSTQASCSGSITVGYDVKGNTYYDINFNNLNTNSRHAVAAHELGHAQSLGHISDLVLAILGTNPNPSTYYVPQQADKGFVNQVYP